MTFEENLEVVENSKTETKSQSGCDIPTNYKEKSSSKDSMDEEFNKTFTSKLGSSEHTSTAVVGRIAVIHSPNKLLLAGNFNRCSAGTLDERLVSVERIPMANVCTSTLEMLLQLNHKSVVKLLHTEQDSDFKYLALEFTVTSMDKLFLEGSHSNKFSVRLPCEKEVLLQLANGLDYIHSQQLVHRDIRPENVHIFPPLNQLGPAVVKWAGFGLFGQVQTSSGSIKETYKFSLEWLSPELLDFLLDEESRPKSTDIFGWKENDIFATGCLFFTYLTGGIHPFGSGREIVTNIKQMKAINAHKLASDHFAHDLIFKTMLKKEPSGRIYWTDVLKKIFLGSEKTKKEEELFSLCSLSSLEDAEIGRFRELVLDVSSVNVNCTDLTGRSPLMLLCHQCNHGESFKRCVEILFKRDDIDPTIENEEGANALHLLFTFNSENASIDVVRQLVQNGVDVQVVDTFGNNILHYLVANTADCEDLAKITRFLIECGIDVQAKTLKGDSVLNLLFQLSNKKHVVETAYLFLLNKVDINQQNEKGENAMHRLCQTSSDVEQFADVLRLLFLCGADLSVETERGDYAFTLLRHFGEDLFEAIDLLLTESKRKYSQVEFVLLLVRHRIRLVPEDFEKMKAFYFQLSQVNLKKIVAKMQSLVTQCIESTQISSPALIDLASIDILWLPEVNGITDDIMAFFKAFVANFQVLLLESRRQFCFHLVFPDVLKAVGLFRDLSKDKMLNFSASASSFMEILIKKVEKILSPPTSALRKSVFNSVPVRSSCLFGHHLKILQFLEDDENRPGGGSNGCSKTLQEKRILSLIDFYVRRSKWLCKNDSHNVNIFKDMLRRIVAHKCPKCYSSVVDGWLGKFYNYCYTPRKSRYNNSSLKDGIELLLEVGVDPKEKEELSSLLIESNTKEDRKLAKIFCLSTASTLSLIQPTTADEEID